MNHLINNRNEHGFKDQVDCYRDNGKLIQWIDEAVDYYIDGTEVTIFWSTVSLCKALKIKHRITTISDGKRLFIEGNRSSELY